MMFFLVTPNVSDALPVTGLITEYEHRAIFDVKLDYFIALDKQ